ncbi:SH3 domain-containing protein [Mucilaginibacter gynuensis]|uniref:SH3 domain-containing protein n=1 Tax=Mucilaginibacter gynuensis TaxID=1302236 RepID=UPI003CD0A5FE
MKIQISKDSACFRKPYSFSTKSLHNGGSVVILDTTEAKGWFKVSYNGNEGYVWNEYVED